MNAFVLITFREVEERIVDLACLIEDSAERMEAMVNHACGHDARFARALIHQLQRRPELFAWRVLLCSHVPLPSTMGNGTEERRSP
jgi:hypothetical protein